MTEDHGRAWVELDFDALRQNVAALSRLLPAGCELMPALKANAYGHGAVPVARELERLGVRAFCVATAAEGVELRQNGVSGDILVLGGTPTRDVSLLRRFGLIQTVADAEDAVRLAACGIPLRVHLKLDTGMHRLGIDCADIEGIDRIFRQNNLLVDGIYTHICGDDMAKTQGERFWRAARALERRGLDCGKKHILASGGLLRYPELGGDYARVGVALYGVLSERGEPCPIPLRPVLSLKARVASVRDLPAGEGVGYGAEGAAPYERRIAALSIGYADGLPRALSNGRGGVLIRGAYAPILGRVCMDQTIVDVTSIPSVLQGDAAVVIGRSGAREITAYDLAEQAGSITNEILSRLGARVILGLV
ncbi:MAG: serine racemase VanT catalytic subunit [Oscillospiraceae bacterium]|nr:serine racemase VanT catalytic subunit [Oscillospiraceae bacterium]